MRRFQISLRQTAALQEQSLPKPLFLSEIEFDPKACGVRDDVLGEGQDTVDVELIEDSVIQLDLSERELFAKLSLWRS